MKKKTIWLFGLMTALTPALFLGCDPDGGTEEETATVGQEANVQVYNENGTPYTGGGTVKIPYDWVDGKKPLYLPVNGGAVANGKLILSLPDAVDDQYLYRFSFPSGVTVTPSDATGVWIEGFDLVSGGTTYYLDKVDKAGHSDNVILFLYASKPSTVTGSKTEGENTGTYNLTLKQGWNEVWYKYVPGTATLTTNLSSAPDMKWVLSPVD
jgi:hypothetical protein